MRPFLALLMFLSTVLVNAGSGTATLTCRSSTGRTILTIKLQDISGMFEGADLKIDGHELHFPAEDNNDCANVIWDPEIGVFTIGYTHPSAERYLFLRFWAIPSTFKIISGNRSSGALYEFDGILEASEPRPGEGSSTPSIRMTCRLEYRI